MDLSQNLEIVTRSDPGMVRSHNEDAVLANSSIGLAILADGMGGYNAGEVASGMATTLLGTELEKSLHLREPHGFEGGKRVAHGVLESEIARANTAIYQAAQSQPQYSGMGTTLVIALFFDNMMTVAHIGDSRLYRLRGEEFKQVTRDHSLLQEQIDSGMITPEQAKHSLNKNLVTRALGVDPVVEPEIRDYDTLPGDIYVLCSDGLSDMVEDEEIGMTLSALSANLELCATQLVQMANDNGGRDNVSVILVRVLKEYPVARGWWARLLAWFK
ncbi:MAG: Stp1/IreP family PP2C-type Ser/Thr phosphatase [Rhodocyclaceae bacterium]|nr:Stp1/IreP family PP2C-type Ser/Thr phosphatase [Rhodocyclaceae bacterium]